MEVNLVIGRFQPFTEGHLKMLKKATEKTKLKNVVFLIFGSRKTYFSEKLTNEYIKEILKNENKIIENIIIWKEPVLIPKMIDKYKEYDFKNLIVGSDRLNSYNSQLNFIKQNNIADINLIVIDRFDDNISATLVREKIKNNDFDEFKKLVPGYLLKFFNKFKEELNN